jgi:hypothetical protein
MYSMKKIYVLAMIFMAPIFFMNLGVSAVEPVICDDGRAVPAQSECATNTPNENLCNPARSFLGLPTWYKYLDAETDSTGRCSPVIENAQAAVPIGIAILEGMIRLGGLVAVVMIFIGAFRYITSQGSPEAATTARKTIINALVGLVIVIVSTSVVSYIGNRIG